jgi:Undecaprenyl-phosphate glucose phosphotransferase
MPRATTLDDFAPTDDASSELARDAQAIAQHGDRRGPMRPATLAPVRMRVRRRSAARVLRFADLLIVGVLSVWMYAMSSQAGLAGAPLGDVAVLLFGSIFTVAGVETLKGYDFGPKEALGWHLARTAGGVVAAGMATSLTMTMLTREPIVIAVGLWFELTLGAVLTLHLAWWLLIDHWRKAGRLVPNVVIVGANTNAERLIGAALKSGQVAVLGIFDDRLDRAPKFIRGVPVLGDLEAMRDHRLMPYVDRVVVTVGAGAERAANLLAKLSPLPNAVNLLLELESEAARDAAVQRIADWSLTPLTGPGHDAGRAFWKRTQDLAIGAVALAVSAPIMAAVALAVKLDSPGPVFFRQRRHGFHNEPILVWKFRSMRHEAADATAQRQTFFGDERVTRVGRFIRATSLDELPQIFNVLKGEMSLVGPRPHAIGMKTGEVDSARLVAEYAHRHRVKPGITGWAAVNGSRGPVDTPELVRERVALDIDYIDRQGFWFDLWIMLITLPRLLGDRHAVR